jgi:hypothetical protein
LAAKASRIRVVDAGSAVEVSITSSPGGAASSRPFDPITMLSTCGEPVTHRMTASAPVTSSALVRTSTAPAANRSCRFVRLRCTVKRSA